MIPSINFSISLFQGKINSDFKVTKSCFCPASILDIPITQSDSLILLMTTLVYHIVFTISSYLFYSFWQWRHIYISYQSAVQSDLSIQNFIFLKIEIVEMSLLFNTRLIYAKHIIVCYNSLLALLNGGRKVHKVCFVA